MRNQVRSAGAVSLVTLVTLVTLALAMVGATALPAEDVPPEGIVVGRMPIDGLAGMEAIVVYYEMPGGAESGKHRMDTGREIVYIQEGSVVLEVEGEDPVTVAAGETFTTVAGQVHNVKNASAEAAVKAVSFYIAEAGGTGATVSVMLE